MDIQEALYQLGVREDTLSALHKQQLDDLGYLHFPQLMSLETITALRNHQAVQLASEGDKAGTEVHQEAGTDRLSDLINKSSIYHLVISNSVVLAAIAHVLGNDLKLSSLNSRDAQPGKGLQGLHADWGRLETPGVYQVCNSLWLLDDFTAENGATRAVPGTHRSNKMPSEVMANPADEHPGQQILIGKAGDVFVVNSHTWHGGTINRTTGQRRVLHGYFCRRNQPQQLDQQKYLRSETWQQLSEAQRTVLGVVDPASLAVV